MNLKNKMALVTGGNSGIGLEIVKQLVKKNCKVIILGKDKQKVEIARKKLNSSLVSTLICDLRDLNQIEKTAKKIKDIDILINSAGIINYKLLEKHDFQNIKDIIDTNLLGTIYITKALLPIMKKKNSGIILNISSTVGVKGECPCYSVYVASKFGVTGFTQALKAEMKQEKKDVKVFGFYPGGVKTKLRTKSKVISDESSFMMPKDVAEIVVFILERPGSVNMDHVVVERNKNL